jgi:hypothetical protein
MYGRHQSHLVYNVEMVTTAVTAIQVTSLFLRTNLTKRKVEEELAVNSTGGSLDCWEDTERN